MDEEDEKPFNRSEHMKAINAARKGTRMSEEQKKNIADGVRGNRHDREGKEKLEGELYPSLITNPAYFTKDHINAIAQKIEEGIHFETACSLCGVDYEKLKLYINKRKKTDMLAHYAEDAFKVAEARAEEKLVKQWISGNYNSKAVQEFLSRTNPKFTQKFKTEMTYELGVILDTVREVVDEETFLAILDALRQVDKHKAIEKLDGIIYR
jgi:hypothetical protein